MNAEGERKKSYELWPDNSPVDPKRLAKAGFYYSGVGDEVVCFSCEGRVKNWNYGDVVLKKHSDLYPECDFIKNKSNNLPLTIHSTKLKNEALTKLCGASNNNNIECADYNKFEVESERLKTFVGKWPLDFISIEELAHAGFFYKGPNDKVQCAYCKGIISRWEDGDIPLQEHLKHFPTCDHVIRNIQEIKKISITTDCVDAVVAEEQITCASVSKINNDVEINRGYLDGLENHSRLIDKSQQHMTLEELGVCLHKGPVHPDQASLAKRLKSFLSWPSNAPVKKEELAAAGFFYVGIDDHVKCFHCNGGLCNWEIGDNPWVEHSRWFCNCDYVRLTKGSDFIKSCIAKNSIYTNICKETAQASQTQEPLIKKVDVAMETNLVKTFLETGLYPPYIVRTAVLIQMKEKGCLFGSADEIHLAISKLKKELSSEPVSLKLADLNPEKNMVENCSIVVPPMENHLCYETATLKNTKEGDTYPIHKNVEVDLSNDHCVCKICMDKEVGVVFLPCGHLLSCVECAPALKFCPMCRKTIHATVRAYLN